MGRVNSAMRARSEPSGPHSPREIHYHRYHRAYWCACAGCDYWTRYVASKAEASKMILAHCEAKNA